MSKDSEIAWLAGVMDGEGTIGMYHTSYKARSKNVITKYSFDVQVWNTDILIIKEFHRIASDIVGYALTIQEKIPNSVDHKRIIYAVMVSGIRNIVTFLRTIEPYLVGKREQANLLLGLLKNHINDCKFNKDELRIIQQLKDLKVKSMEIVDGDLPSLNCDSAKLDYEQLEFVLEGEINWTQQQ